MYYLIVNGTEIVSASTNLRLTQANAGGGTIVTLDEVVDVVGKMYVNGEVVDIPLTTEETRLEELDTLESMSAIELLSLTDSERTTKINRYKEIK